MNDKPINEYLKEDFSFICRRLKEIRNELRKEYDAENSKENPYKQINMAAFIGIKPANLMTLESHVITYNTFKLISIYQSLGYNIDWIVTEDNEFINKKRIQNNIVVKTNVREDFKKMEEGLLQCIKAFKATL